MKDGSEEELQVRPKKKAKTDKEAKVAKKAKTGK